MVLISSYLCACVSIVIEFKSTVKLEVVLLTRFYDKLTKLGKLEEVIK